MITVTSAEKNRIEGQMKTALPFLNGQVTFEIGIEEGKSKRSQLTFKKEDESFSFPIFYVTPSTDDSEWEILTDRIEEQTDSQGIFVIKFNSEQHTIQNAMTYALTNNDLYEKNVLTELCRLCSYFDFEPYQLQLFDPDKVNDLMERLQNKTLYQEENKEEQLVQLVDEDSVDLKNEKTIEVKPVTPVVKEETKADTSMKISPEEDKQLDSDIRALINDCFGLF